MAQYLAVKSHYPVDSVFRLAYVSNVQSDNQPGQYERNAEMAWGNEQSNDASNATPEYQSQEWWKRHDELLAKHEEAKATLEAAKNSEMEWRKAYADFAFPEDKRREGMNTLELANGYQAKLQQPFRYNLVGDNDAIEAVEDKAEAIGNEGTFLIERIITWKPGFSKSEYSKLDESNPTHAKVKALVDSVLEIKPGTPSLEIKAPKAKLNS